MIFVLVEHQISQKHSSLILDIFKKKVDELDVQHTLYCGKGIPARLDLLACNKVSQTSSFTAYLKVSDSHSVCV